MMMRRDSIRVELLKILSMFEAKPWSKGDAITIEAPPYSERNDDRKMKKRPDGFVYEISIFRKR